MQRKTMLAWSAVCALAIGSCSETPRTSLSPSALEPSTTFVNPDGSTMKVMAPQGLGPNGGPVDSQRPTLTFTNAIGLLVPVSIAHEVEIQDASGTVIYNRLTGETASAVSHAVEIDLPYAATLWWRARGRFGEAFGPWSIFAQFTTPNPPAAGGGGPGGTLPFPVPAECGPFGPDNRFGCAAAVASQSAEWRTCAGGRDVGCHRFTRQVAYALAQSDPNWKLIVAAPGGHACNCSGCGGSDGSMFREDAVVYDGSRVYDLVVGAGGPSPSLQWSRVPGPRSTDRPGDAPLCEP